jgi:hypothetical protein
LRRRAGGAQGTRETRFPARLREAVDAAGACILRGCAGIPGETGRKSGEQHENNDYNAEVNICALHYNVVCADGGPPIRRRMPSGRPGDAASSSGILVDDPTPPEWKLQ